MIRTQPRLFALLTVLVGALAVLAPSPAAAVEEPPLSTSRNPEGFDWANATIDLPWTGAVLKDGTVCPGGRVNFDPTQTNPFVGQATVGELTYSIRSEEVGRITGQSAFEAVVSIGCAKHAAAGSVGARYYYLFQFTKKNSKDAFKPQVRDFITSGQESSDAPYRVTDVDGHTTFTTEPGEVVVRHWLLKDGTYHSRTFAWTDKGFVPNVPFAPYPEVDTAPV